MEEDNQLTKCHQALISLRVEMITPTNTIIGYAIVLKKQLLEMEVIDESSEMVEYLTHIIEAGTRLRALSDDIILFMKDELS